MRTWTVDTRAPEVSISEPADNALVRGEVFIAAEASDDRELGKVEFLVDGEVVDVDRGGAAGRDEPYEFGWDTTLEADGEHTFGVRATDAAGNATSSPSRTARVDNTAPDTVVTGSPNDPTNAAVVPFEFRSDDSGAAFECSFGGPEFETCESPREYEFSGARPDGDYVFRVRAVDEAGNRDDSPAERVVTLDTRAPDAPVVERPADGGQDNDGALVFSGTAEPGSRVRILELSGDGAETRATSRRAGDDGAWSVGLANVPDGEHGFVAVATDAAGNESERSETRTVTVDTVAPEVRGVSPDRDAVGAPINTNVGVVFSKRIDGATLNGNFTLTRERDGSVTQVPASVEYDAATNSATLRPDADLGYSESYTATVRGGEGGIKDLAGSGLAADESWTFTTAEEPDTMAPDAPTIERPAEDAYDDDGAFTVSGAAEPGSRVRLFEAGGTPVGAAIAGQDGAWSVDLAGVPEGDHAYEATATDDARNESGRSAGRTVVVDQTNPDTIIETSPDSHTNRTAVDFGFTSNEPGSVFECSIDGGAFERCGSTREYAGLADGDHVFEVRAVDRAGNADPSQARRSFTVDTESPEATITSPAEGALVRGEVEFTATASDGRGIWRVQFLVDGDLVDSDLEGPYEFGWDSALKQDGAHTVEVRVTDRAGNTATSAPRGIRSDNTAPDTRITSSPDTTINTSRAAFGFSSGEGDAAFECSIDGVEFEPCESPRQYTDLPDGDYLFTVRAKDGAGNRDETPAQRRLTIDTEAPNVSIDAGPTGSVGEPTARLAFSSEPGVTFECRIDGGAFGRCGPSAEYDGLGEGRHVFEVRATDAAGNTGPIAERAWIVQTSTSDAAGPTVLSFGPKGKKATSRSAVSVVFSEDLDATTVNKATFRLVRKGTTRPVAATVAYDPATGRVVLRPGRGLVRGAVYTATVTTGIENSAGNPLAANKTWRFKVR